MTPRRPDPLPRGAMPLRERHTIAESWLGFVRAIGLDNPAVPEQQLVEMRRAFYAGAATMFGLITHDTDGGVEPTELDMQYITSLFAELEYFKRMLARGEA
jgi:hypothetical protein